MKILENCIVKKDVRIWNSKQEVERASFQIVDSTVIIAIKNALKAGEDDIKIQNLLKNNAALNEKIELLIHERSELHVIQNRFAESGQKLKGAEVTTYIGNNRFSKK